MNDPVKIGDWVKIPLESDGGPWKVLGVKYDGFPIIGCYDKNGYTRSPWKWYKVPAPRAQLWFIFSE